MRRCGVPVCAVERPGQCPLRVELARPHLLYAKWLRRENRHVDARAQLRIACDETTSIGMEAFAYRAGRELLATGEPVCKRSAETRDDLTPQQRQIAELADDGLSVRTQKRVVLGRSRRASGATAVNSGTARATSTRSRTTHAPRQVPAIAAGALPARVHRTSRHADATSSNDRAHTRHLTRADAGATRARVMQAWTRLV
jgi:hypothetical protein